METVRGADEGNYNRGCARQSRTGRALDATLAIGIRRPALDAAVRRDATMHDVWTKKNRTTLCAVFFEILVGVRGFEPPASTSRT
ncbi:hypothetical protein PT2222_280088 [Paraburkholderia tropica]